MPHKRTPERPVPSAPCRMFSNAASEPTPKPTRCVGYANCCSCPACTRRERDLPSRLSTSATVQAEIRVLLNYGFTYSGPPDIGEGHCFYHEDHGEMVLRDSEQPRWQVGSEAA